MVKIKNLALALLTLATAAGCALPRVNPSTSSAPPIAAPAAAQPGYALVYLARPRHGYASDVWPDVYLNDTNVVALKNGSYSYVYAPPGRYQVVAKKAQWYSAGWGERIDVFLEPNKTYLLSLEVQDASADDDRAWVLAESENALSPLRGQRYLPANAEQI